VQDPFLSQAYDRYAYVFDNPLRYVDPTGHLTDEELARLFGFKDVESMFAAEWVKALQKSEVWQALKDAKNGDILAFRVGEQSYHWMFVASEEGGVGFWDMESRQLVAGDTDFFGAAFGMMDSWGLLRDEDRHGQKWEQVRASAGSSWEDYTPRPGWREGRTGQVKLHQKYDWSAIGVDIAAIGGGGFMVFTTPFVGQVIGGAAIIFGICDVVDNFMKGDYVDDYRYIYHHKE